MEGMLTIVPIRSAAKKILFIEEGCSWVCIFSCLLAISFFLKDTWSSRWSPARLGH